MRSTYGLALFHASEMLLIDFLSRELRRGVGAVSGSDADEVEEVAVDLDISSVRVEGRWRYRTCVLRSMVSPV